MSLVAELNRRSVFRVGIAYLVTAWLLITIARAVVAPHWLIQLLVIILAAGFLPALIFAWYYELTPAGLKLNSEAPPDAPPKARRGRKLETILIIMFGLSSGISIWKWRFEQRLAEHQAETEAAAEAAAQPPERAPRISESEQIEANSIAVLPFANLGAAVEDLYLTDGIHEDLLIQLARIGAFSVISRGSVMDYRDTQKDTRQIARELSVANVVAGSVQRAGDRVRINVQMIDAATDDLLWAQTYDRALTAENLFQIQSETARSVASALKATLTTEELADVAAVPTENDQAYDLYLRARQFAQTETHAGVQSAIDLLQQSLELDPGFKNAWIRLARAHMTRYWVYGGDPANRNLAREAIDRARAIDSDFAELSLAEGFYWYWGHLDYERALYHLEKAIRQMPGSDKGHMWLGWVSRRAGLWDQAVGAMREALRLNPRVAFNWHEYALTEMYRHQYPSARAAISRARELDPDSAWSRATEAQIVLQQGGDVAAAQALTRGAEDSDEFDFFEAWLDALILGRAFDQALAAARSMPDDLELRRNLIDLREMRSSRILHFMGQVEEAQRAAAAAATRLRSLRDRLGEDYRLDLAEAWTAALSGSAEDEVRSLVDQSAASRPDDSLEAIRIGLAHGRIYAMAGLAEESVAAIEPLLSPPSDTSVHEVRLDPAFDGVRTHPAFIAMMERHR